MLPTRHDLARWIDDARPGDKFVYFTGYFFAEQQRRDPDAVQIVLIGRAAWELMEAGKVDLVQRRIGDAFYEYIAIARKKPYKKVVWEGCYDPKRKSYVKPAYLIQLAA